MNIIIASNQRSALYKYIVYHGHNILISSQVTSKKKTVKYNLPIQIGFFVYQYAKLRMLEFFYDVIDKFIDRSNYCLLEMDTGTVMY